MSSYFIGNDNFYFLLGEVTNLPIEKLELPSEITNLEGRGIVILESLDLLEDFLAIEEDLMAIIIYIDEIKMVHLNLLKEFSIRIILKEKKDYIYCDAHIEDLESNLFLNEESKIIVSDVSEEVVIQLGEIIYFSYDRITKKSFAKVGNEIFFLRKNLGELEGLLPEDLFFRLDRSYIVNFKQVKGINFKEEFILFKNDEKIYINRGKLKTLSKKLYKKYYIL